MFILVVTSKQTIVKLHFFLLLLLCFTVDSCKSTADPAALFEIQLEGRKKQFQNGEVVGVAIKNKKEKEIQKVAYQLDGEDLNVNNGKINLKVRALGSKVLTAKIDYEGNSVEIKKKIRVLANKAPEIYRYEILNTFPHDKKAYTQGLEFHGDTLFESTGNPSNVSQSVLRKLNFRTGEIYQEIELDNSVFGEGLTVINGKVIQLTWRSGIGYVYDQTNLEQLDTFRYGQSKEGWGLCNDGTTLYKSDGTEKIWLLDPETLTEQGYIETVTNTSIFNKANELEFIEGKIYANVWQKDSMMIIDPDSGAIEGVINFGGLKDSVEQHEDLDVLNGVAYHPERKTLFVTGKNWDTLFEVKIIKK